MFTQSSKNGGRKKISLITGYDNVFTIIPMLRYEIALPSQSHHVFDSTALYTRTPGKRKSFYPHYILFISLI